MGCPGSGNNLIALILDSHSKLSVFPGTHYYQLFHARRHLYGDLRRRPNVTRLVRDFTETLTVRELDLAVPSVDDVLDELSDSSFEGVFAAFTRAYARGRGKIRGGERTSRHFVFLPEILERYPESSVIYTVRDPRDVAFSGRASLRASLKAITDQWNLACRLFEEASRPVHLVRYEDLVSCPERTITEACAALGEEYEATMLDFHRSTPAHFRRIAHHEALTRPLNADAVGVFRQFESSEIALVESRCAVGMLAMGYTLTAPVDPGAAHTTRAQGRVAMGSLLDRLRYYGLDRERWRIGATNWKIGFRVWARYVSRLGFLRR